MQLLLGHRGAPHLAPENTMEAFRKAMEAGAAGFEFDVRKSADGKLVVIHDPSKGRLRVSRTRAAQLGLPLLEDVLREFSTAWLDIEMKVAGIEREVLALAHRYLRPRQFVITSFRAHSVREVKRLSPSTLTGWLFNRRFLRWPAWAEAPGVDFLCPRYNLLNQRMTRGARERGLRVITWTVDEPADMRRVAPLADVVITNLPERYA